MQYIPPPNKTPRALTYFLQFFPCVFLTHILQKHVYIQSAQNYGNNSFKNTGISIKARKVDV